MFDCKVKDYEIHCRMERSFRSITELRSKVQMQLKGSRRERKVSKKKKKEKETEEGTVYGTVTRR